MNFEIYVTPSFEDSILRLNVFTKDVPGFGLRLRISEKSAENVRCYVLCSAMLGQKRIGYSWSCTSFNGFCLPYEVEKPDKKWHSTILGMEVAKPHRGKGYGTQIFRKTFETLKSFSLRDDSGILIHAVGAAYKFYMKQGGWFLCEEYEPRDTMMCIPYTTIKTENEFCSFLSDSIYFGPIARKLYEVNRYEPESESEEEENEN
jgi:GNAT superfamily N-acetyltransferase